MAYQAEQQTMQLVMKFEHLTPEEILKVNIPTGVPLVYTFDTDFNVLDKR